MDVFAQRFWARVERGSQDKCWPWKATKLPQGYGIVSGRAVGLKYPVGTHRVAYWLTNGGEFPKDPVCVLHSCDNPPCCNPAHLRLGNRQDNKDDQVAKRRTVSILTPEDVLEIRAVFDAMPGRCPQGFLKRMAEKYGVQDKTIWEVRKRINWKHVK